MKNLTPFPVAELPEIIDPERLPLSPLVRYYIADCPFPPDEFEEPYPYVEAESAANAALMARTLYGPTWGRFALMAWRDAETNEVHRYAPGIDSALAMLHELDETEELHEASTRIADIKRSGNGKEQL